MHEASAPSKMSATSATSATSDTKEGTVFVTPVNCPDLLI
jgi:hypothetical protein